MPDELPDGVMPEHDIIFLDELAELKDWEPSDPTPSPELDQRKAFFKESFIFLFKGFKQSNPDESVQVVIAMPQEAVMFIITTAMQRAAEQQGNSGLATEPIPPTSPGGLFLPGSN